MEKIKFTVIVGLGILSLGYHLIGGGIFTWKEVDTVFVLIEGQIGSKTSDSLLGVLFDLLIEFLFHIRINDLSTYFKIFGG